jgi:hypothetical protein
MPRNQSLGSATTTPCCADRSNPASAASARHQPLRGWSGSRGSRQADARRAQCRCRRDAPQRRRGVRTVADEIPSRDRRTVECRIRGPRSPRRSGRHCASARETPDPGWDAPRASRTGPKANDQEQIQSAPSHGGRARAAPATGFRRSDGTAGARRGPATGAQAGAARSHRFLRRSPRSTRVARQPARTQRPRPGRAPRG